VSLNEKSDLTCPLDQNIYKIAIVIALSLQQTRVSQMFKYNYRLTSGRTDTKQNIIGTMYNILIPKHNKRMALGLHKIT